LDFSKEPKRIHLSTVLVAGIVIASLFTGGLLGYSINGLTLRNQVSSLEEQISHLQSTQNITYQNNTYLLDRNVSISQLYEQVKESVVVIQGIIVQYDIFHRPYYSQVQGSGFIHNFTGQMVIITNYHVINGAINITVTFTNGNGYGATVLGSDPYADLAILSADAPQTEYNPLKIADLSTLEVGDPVIAVGAPYGLTGSMTVGIVSALGRTITEDLTGGYAIANVIQTTTPLNPGNSGGPLLNYLGEVVGITTAIVTDSEGLGFAIPSTTILREIKSLVTQGSYTLHPWLGASGTDMTYAIAEAMDAGITYGWLITEISPGGPADNAGLQS
jgi:S1-C subfamily serine protease